MKVVGAQELDKRWKISTETAIKAKSMRGYATYTRYATYQLPTTPGVSHFFLNFCILLNPLHTNSGSSNVTNVTNVQTTGSSNFRNITLQILRKYKHRKLTENKFKPGVARPELVEDWDQVKFQQLQMSPKNTN